VIQHEREFPDGLTAVLKAQNLTYVSTVEDQEIRFASYKYRRNDGKHFLVKILRTSERTSRMQLQREGAVMSAIPDRSYFRIPKPLHIDSDFIIREHVDGKTLPAAADPTHEECEQLAKALYEFQSVPQESLRKQVTDKDSITAFYLKRLGKHIVHLWPQYISSKDIARAVWRLLSAFPILLGDSVPCHADLRFSNILFSEGKIVFLDLEAFRIKNHPLYDVISVMCEDPRLVDKWTWQPAFFKLYLSQRGQSPWKSEKQAVRLLKALLTFFMIYRFNECRMAAQGRTYFNGGNKLKFLVSRIRKRFSSPLDRPDLTDAEAIRIGNMRKVLGNKECTSIVRGLLSVRDTDVETSGTP
jgi:thiamine kinase-like enzyme